MPAIFDGYFDDALTGCSQSQGVLATCTARVLNTVVPTPEVIISLAADPQAVNGRPPGRLKEGRNLAEQIEHTVWVNTSGSRERAVQDIVRATVGALERRLGWQ